jgi:hypothetical protein
MNCDRRDQAEAYAAGVLQGDTLDAFKGHLASCARCAETVRLASGSRRLLSELSPFEPSEIELRRIDRSVSDAFRRPQRRTPWVWALAGVPLAASAVAVTLFLRPPTGGLPAEPMRALILAAGGETFVSATTGTVPVAALRTIGVGDRIKTRSGEVVLQTAPATGVRIRSSSELEVQRLQAGHTVMYLDRGEVVAEVKKIAAPASDAFVIRTPDLTISVRGTAFRVVRTPGETFVEVAHGTVALERGRDELLLSAAQRARVKDGEALDQVVREGGVSDDFTKSLPLGIPDAPIDVVARDRRSAMVTSEPSGARVDVDDIFRGPTPLSTVESAGPHRMRVAAPDTEPAEMTLDTSAHADHHVALAPRKVAMAAPIPAAVEPPRPATAKGAEVVPAPPKVETVPVDAFQRMHVVAARPPGAVGTDPKLAVNDQIDRLYREDVEQCAKDHHLDLKGAKTATITFRVLPTGSIAEPGVVVADQDNAFGDCVQKKSRHWSFELPKGAAKVTSDEPFTYDAKLP